MLIVLYAFNASTIQSWPIHLSLRWFPVAWHDEQVRSALGLSLKAAFAATGMALLLGSCAAFAVHRFRFFGREAVSFLLVLPIALPGIVTGIALQSFFSFGNVTLGLFTIIVGHATFCIVVVYNNVVARLRRTHGSLVEASMDLGAGGFTTFRWVTFPMIRTALVAGALLAFALSFDEVIVTIFTAGRARHAADVDPRRHPVGQQFPEVNVVVFAILVVTVPLIRASGSVDGWCGYPHVSRDARG